MPFHTPLLIISEHGVFPDRDLGLQPAQVVPANVEGCLAVARGDTDDYRGFGGLDCVIEAVVENMDIKKLVLGELEQEVSRDCLICTNTSSLPIDEMAEALEHPERFVGLLFFAVLFASFSSAPGDWIAWGLAILAFPRLSSCIFLVSLPLSLI